MVRRGSGSGSRHTTIKIKVKVKVKVKNPKRQRSARRAETQQTARLTRKLQAQSTTAAHRQVVHSTPIRAASLVSPGVAPAVPPQHQPR